MIEFHGPLERSGRRLALRALGFLLPCFLPAPVPAVTDPGGSFVRVPVVVGAPTALAWAPSRERLAIGDERGVDWAEGGVVRRVLRRGPVYDLAFAASGVLLAATERGLFRIAHDGTSREIPLGPGLGARRVGRVWIDGSLAVAATEGGAFIGPIYGDGPWTRLDGALPDGPVAWAALRRWHGVREVWLFARGEVYRARLGVDDAGILVATAVERPLRGERGGRDVVDIAFGFGSTEVALLTPLGLRLLGPDESRFVRPALPPGSTPVRLAAHQAALWIATDRGLLRASDPEGPWERALPPLGSAPIADLAGDPRRLFVAGPRDVYSRSRSAGGRVVVADDARFFTPGTLARLESEPAVADVHAVVLRRQGLRTDRLRGLERGLRWRGILPDVLVNGGLDWRRGRVFDYDQSFSSGLVRNLFDEEHARQQDTGVFVQLRWELGDLAYDPESIDVMREARETVELRDEVLDEVNQLYFERRRVLADLALLDAGAPEATRLAIRADELTAGLDAWTDGWFGARAVRVSRVASPPPDPDRSSRP